MATGRQVAPPATGTCRTVAGRSRPLQIFQHRSEAERWLERQSVPTKAEGYRQY